MSPDPLHPISHFLLGSGLIRAVDACFMQNSFWVSSYPELSMSGSGSCLKSQIFSYINPSLRVSIWSPPWLKEAIQLCYIINRHQSFGGCNPQESDSEHRVSDIRCRVSLRIQSHRDYFLIPYIAFPPLVLHFCFCSSLLLATDGSNLISSSPIAPWSRITKS